jgi:hypothetical protein
MSHHILHHEPHSHWVATSPKNIHIFHHGPSS